ncbi:MAG: hypothetical protein IPH13_21755 [Planctomycetes bacterium]|nr:hypothetical protein [Planctomycetota bacterium]
MQYAYDHLAPRTAMGREGVFFVSSLDAVIGRENGDEQMVERSRIPAVEKSLAKFLVEHRGRVKLLQPASQLSQGLKSALYETIPSRRKMLDASLEDLEARVQEALPKLEEAEKRRQKTLEILERGRIRLRDAVRDAAASHLRAVAADVPQWATELALERISVFKFWALEEQVQGVAKEVLGGVEQKIEEATARWQDRRLKPLIADHLADFGTDAHEALDAFLLDVESIRRSLRGESASNVLSDARVGKVERWLAGVGGFVLGGAGSAIEGVAMGYNGMLRSLLPSILITVAGVMVLHLNPITIIPALIATGIFRSWRKGDALTSKAKVEIGNGIRVAIIESVPEHSRRIAEQCYEQSAPQLKTLGEAMSREIDTVRETVDSVLEVKRCGAQRIAAEREQIASQEKCLQGIETQVSEFVHGLAGGRT